MRRREFLKLTTALCATAAAPAIVSMGTPQARPMALPGTGRVATTPIVCNICFWRCAGTAYTEDGKPWKLVGNDNDLHSLGNLCVRGTGGLGSYLDSDRLQQPLLRVTENGEQKFKPVSWDEALDFIADKMRGIAEQHGEDRIALFQHGAGGSFFHTLLKAFGAGASAKPSFAQCRGPIATGFKLTFGEDVFSPERIHLEKARCVVLIGSHLGENMHSSQVNRWMSAVEGGANLITVDPRFSVAAGKAKHWLPIRPGADLALLLAWMNVLIGENLHDADYIARYANGFDQLADHVARFTPEWAAEETGIPADTIRQTAREMAAAAPATIVHPGRHGTWYGDDTQRTRAIAILNALLGAWGREGGFYIPEKVKLPGYPLPEFPKPKRDWRKIVQSDYPMVKAGITNEFINASVGDDAFFKGWFVYSTNLPITIPAGVARLDEAAQSLDLLVAVDTMPADITGYADVVLPECTYLERYDPLRNKPEREPSLALSAPVFEPKHDTKPAWWMAKQLAERLGLGQYFPYDDYAEVLDSQLRQVGSSLDELKETGVKTFARKKPMFFSEGEDVTFKTPSGKIELWSQALADNGHDPMPVYTPPKRPPHGYFHLNYGRAPMHTFGRTANNPHLFEMMPENAVWVNPRNGQRLGLKTGDYVKLRNQDGIVSNAVRVRVTERVGPDSVFIVHGFGHEDPRLRRASARGASDAQLMTKILIDPVTGATGMRGNFVTIVPEGEPA